MPSGFFKVFGSILSTQIWLASFDKIKLLPLSVLNNFCSIPVLLCSSVLEGSWAILLFSFWLSTSCLVIYITISFAFLSSWTQLTCLRLNANEKGHRNWFYAFQFNTLICQNVVWSAVEKLSKLISTPSTDEVCILIEVPTCILEQFVRR